MYGSIYGLHAGMTPVKTCQFRRSTIHIPLCCIEYPYKCCSSSQAVNYCLLATAAIGASFHAGLTVRVQLQGTGTGTDNYRYRYSTGTAQVHYRYK